MRSARLLTWACLSASIAAPALGQMRYTQTPPSCENHTHYTIDTADGTHPGELTYQDIDAINRKLAASGNTDAAFELGLAYMQGYGVPQDLQKAAQWFQIGAVKPADKELIGMFYETGICFALDDEKAIKWYAAAGRPSDSFSIAQIYRRKTPPDIPKATTLYRQLLTMPQSPEFRRAQMELGNLVLDGKYSAGDDTAAHALNLEWARIITQELLGQQEYTIAVAYSASVDGVPKNDAMWLRFCKRAAAYNIDLAQRSYGESILHGEVPNTTPLEGYAWVLLASNKQTGYKVDVAQMEHHMSPAQRTDANSIFDGLVETRKRDGAYYPADDPLKQPPDAELASMPNDDPDVQLRRAFALESSARPEAYAEAMQLYRIARDRRVMDIRVVLGRDYLYATNGISKDSTLSKYWLTAAADAGSRPAALYLAKWYSGEGAPTPDPAQAYAWQWLGTETSPKPTPDHLSSAQKDSAEQQIAAWRANHPGW